MIGAIGAIFALGLKEGERKAAIAEVQADVKKHDERLKQHDDRLAVFDTNFAVVRQRLETIEDTSKDTQRMVRRMYERGNGGGA